MNAAEKKLTRLLESAILSNDKDEARRIVSDAKPFRGDLCRVLTERLHFVLDGERSGNLFPDIEMILALVGLGADPDGLDARGRTTLHRAAALSPNQLHCPEIKALVSVGANIHILDNEGRPPLHHLRRFIPSGVHMLGGIRYAYLRGASGETWLNALLNDGGYDPEERIRHTRETVEGLFGLDEHQEGPGAVLRSMILEGKSAQLRQEIARCPSGADARDAWGWTPLHWAAVTGVVDDAKVLLESGARVDATDDAGTTPLHFACRLGHPLVVALLLAHKADANAPDSHGRTPLEDALFSLPVRDANMETIQRLLTHGADPLARTSEGDSPFALAFMLAPDVVRIFLRAGFREPARTLIPSLIRLTTTVKMSENLKDDCRAIRQLADRSRDIPDGHEWHVDHPSWAYFRRPAAWWGKLPPDIIASHSADILINGSCPECFKRALRFAEI